MKGLICTHLGRREEGLELVKQGVRLDLTSHICWHVFGLIQKGQKNYEEALKSYTQALRFDKVSSVLLSALTPRAIPPYLWIGSSSPRALRRKFCACDTQRFAKLWHTPHDTGYAPGAPALYTCPLWDRRLT